jgi:hypothetical protein
MRSDWLLALLALLVIPVASKECPAQDVDSTFLFPHEFTYAGSPRTSFLGAQPRRETEFQPLPAAVVGTAFLGLGYTLHQVQMGTWCTEPPCHFHIQEDWQYTLQNDKFGHFFGGYSMSWLMGDILLDCGLDLPTATITGGVLGLAYQTYVEVLDGYATQWGFSPSDAVANTLGAGLYVAQYYSPFLQNFTPRWNYAPPQWTGERGLNMRQANFIDDYNSSTFWLACDVERLLPASLSAYWPDWAMVSVGYGIRDYEVRLPSGEMADPYARYMIGLDYNWMRIIPPLPGVLNLFRQALNYLRLPGPTFEFSNRGTRFHILYPYVISIANIRF